MSAHFTAETYGHELRDIRHALGFDQQQMGEYLGVCRDTVCRYETNRHSCPEPIIRLARMVYRQLGAKRRS